MSGRVMTVRGTVSDSQLGFCQCHEHLGISRGVSFERNPVLLIDDVEKSTLEAQRLVAAGGGTIVDAQPGGCNRMEALLRSVSEASGLHIIASTGFHKPCFYPRGHWLFTFSREDLAQFFTDELTVGMYPDIDRDFSPERLYANSDDEHPVPDRPRAGIVKMALDQGEFSPVFQKLFAAGAQAALAAGVPAMVHIEQNSDPVALFEFLCGCGLSPERMIFCHMDRAIPDLAVHKRLLSEGIFLEYDTIGRFKYHSDEEELRIFRSMLDAGYEDQLLFSLDTTRARLKAYDPAAIGLDYLLTCFVPLMEKNGITDTQIRKISHDNFVRVFTGSV